MSASLDRIEASIIDGRARTPRHIQKQLLALYNTLLRSLAPIQQAIAQESGCSATEIWLETSQVLGEVKDHFSKILLDDFLQEEYSIAFGQNRPTRRRPHGCIYIIPSLHTRLYSIVQPMAVAIAAGCCVVVELSPDSSALDKVIAEALTPAMDKDTFAIITQRPQGDILAEEYTIVTGDAEVEFKGSPFMTALKSPCTSTVAIVDRSADILEAARHIVRARFSFRGESPYAPDLVLVNEFVVDEFCQAAVKLLTGQLPPFSNTNHQGRSNLTKSTAKGSQRSEGILLVSTARGSIELFAKRDQIPVTKKTDTPLLVIHPITSLDDAIDTAQATASMPNALLALYLFAELKAAKYLSQFISADLSLINYIPSQLLVGPAAPAQYPASISGRYTKDMFSSPSPELVVPTEKEQLWMRYLDGQMGPQDAEKLKADMTKPLADIGEPEGGSVGFFEQGFYLGMAVEVLAISGIFALCAKYAITRVLLR